MTANTESASQMHLPHNWAAIEESLDAYGHAVLPTLLTPDTCVTLAARYPQKEGYRARIVMARHGFGRGEYKYFAYPLPPLLEQLRHALYSRLVPVANRWNQQMGIATQYPADLHAFLKRCHEAGETRPTPLILAYGPGDYNCLHQDLYGEHVFPLQVAILLSEPDRDFMGGEFIMTEHTGSQGRAEVVNLHQGDAVAFAVHQRPVTGKRGGVRKTSTRHGVSRIHSGQRHTIGLIFHDAR